MYHRFRERSSHSEGSLVQQAGVPCEPSGQQVAGVDGIACHTLLRVAAMELLHEEEVAKLGGSVGCDGRVLGLRWSSEKL